MITYMRWEDIFERRTGAYHALAPPGTIFSSQLNGVSWLALMILMIYETQDRISKKGKLFLLLNFLFLGCRKKEKEKRTKTY